MKIKEHGLCYSLESFEIALYLVSLKIILCEAQVFSNLKACIKSNSLIIQS